MLNLSLVLMTTAAMYFEGVAHARDIARYTGKKPPIEANIQDGESTERPESNDPQGKLIDSLTDAISKRYPGAKITVGPRINWTHKTSGQDFQSVSLLGESSRGEMMFVVMGDDGRRDGEGWAEFSAWTTALISTKRLHPGERVTQEMFSRQSVNIAVGQPHELRGVLLDADTQLGNLETRQSILEGQLLLSTAVQKVPDVRRGDIVTVQVVSNGLSLQTQGVASEPAYSGSQIRVTTSKTKRELVGKLSTSGVVEVKL